MRRLIQQFLASESGATAIEYGLIAAGIAAVIVAAVSALGSSVLNNFTSVSTALK